MKIIDTETGEEIDMTQEEYEAMMAAIRDMADERGL